MNIIDIIKRIYFIYIVMKCGGNSSFINMNRLLKCLIISFLFAAAGCSGARGTSSLGFLTPTFEPTQAARITPSSFEPITTPAPSPTTSPQSSTDSLITSRCSLLDSYDLANLYTTHTEVVLPTPQVSQVNHVAFSTQSVSADEISCVYYVFHLPGSVNEQVLQVSYWVDTPARATPAAWAQVWTEASSSASQAISGIGQGAFYEAGKLTFKKGDFYVTIEVVGTSDTLNTSTPAGLTDQLKIEKQIALDALKNF
jgi:hypothetical protein